jgi:hypothetical protein
MRQAQDVHATELAPLDTTLSGIVPWLVSLWRKLRAAVEKHQATTEEQEIFHLMEYVTSTIGRPVLAASDLDDLDDQIDSLLSAEGLLDSIQHLLAQHLTFLKAIETPSTERFAEIAVPTLGAAQARRLTEAQPMLDAWLDAQRQAFAYFVAEGGTVPERRHDVDLASPEIPPEIAEYLFHIRRAIVCLMAIVRSAVGEQAMAPWLAHAVTERFIESAKQQLRMLASLPDITVDEAIIPRGERLDLSAIAERHVRARDVARRTLRAAQMSSPS